MSAGAPGPWTDAMPTGAAGGVRVLASGSRGNCSVLIIPGRNPRVTLIDAGISPSRTRKLLADMGIEPWQVDDIVLTHLDADHAHAGWASALQTTQWRATLRLARRHMGRAERIGLLYSKTEPFDANPFELGPARVLPVMLDHDALGVAAFRFDIPSTAGPASIGFATDLGRATDALVRTMRGVDVLAIESNYCPHMQLASDRPAFLKRRIMDGGGHLSNEQAAQAVRAIRPRQGVVLLHLSQQCNRPGLALDAHAGAGVPVTVSDQFEPADWVWASASGERTPEPVVMRTMPLFGAGARECSVA